MAKKRKRKGGTVPLSILKKRLSKLSRIVASRDNPSLRIKKN